MTEPTSVLAKLKKERKSNSANKSRVRVGMATCGISAGADKVFDEFMRAVGEAGLDVRVIPTGCVGRCDLEPMAEVTRDNEPPVLYIRLTPEKARKIVEEHLVGGKPVDEYSQ